MKVILAVTVIVNEDGSVGLQTTSKNEFTIVGLLMKGIQIAQGQVDIKAPSPILTPELN